MRQSLRKLIKVKLTYVMYAVKNVANLNGGCMQSFDLLALKLRPCIGYTAKD